MEEYNVALYDMNHKAEFQTTVHADEDSENIVLQLTIGENIIIGESESYLSAYQQIRDRLLSLGFGLRCNGSLINAVQSGMMGYVPKVYLVELGKQALMKDVVSIWDYCKITDFPDTAAQIRFFEKWIESLRG